MSPPTVPSRDGEEQRADAGQHAARDIAERDRAPHRDAGIVRRAARAADRGDVPAGPQPGQEDMAEDGDDDIDQRHGRNAEDVAAADEIPGRDVGEGRRDGVGVALDQEIVGRAVDDQRDQRGDEGAQPQISDQDAVDGAEQRAAEQGGDHHRRDRPAQHVEQIERAEIGQREDRADRQIDAADDDDQRQPERDEADLAGLARGVGEARRRQEVVDGPAEREADDQEQDDRDGGLGPSLGQDFAEQMIGPVAVTQARQGVAHRHSSDALQMSRATSRTWMARDAWVWRRTIIS